LSATFPFISPAARPDIESERDHPAYHLLDSGVTDNSGWTAVREWLDAVRGDVGCRRVVLVDIRSIPSSKPGVRAPINEAWTLELTGALRALLESRNARHARVGDDMAEFDVGWRRDHRPIERVVFSLDDATVPLTWNLGHADEVRLAAAWGRNRPSVDRVRALLTGDQACTP
jgi:hypothetical protein